MGRPRSQREHHAERAARHAWRPSALLRRASFGTLQCAPFYLALWSLILLSEGLGEPVPSIARGVALLLLAVLTAHEVGRRWREGLSKGDVASLLLVLLGVAGTLVQACPALLFGATWIVGITGLDRRTDNATTRARCIVMIGIVGTILSSTPGLWNAVNRLAVSLTTALFSWAGGGGLGATASGLSVLVLVSPFLLSAAVRSRPRRLAPLGVAVALFLAHAGAASICGFAPRIRFTAELVYAALLLAVCVGSLCWRRPSAVRGCQRGWGRALGLVFVFGLACILIALPGVAPGRGYTDPRTVLFVDHTLLGSWDTPADAAPGSAFSGATFGQFPEYVKASGHRVVVGTEIDDDAVRDVDLVVIINPGAPFSEEAKETLYAFVQAGGGLLVLGDHTDIGGIMGAVNDLTVPLGLSLAFDSAVSLDPGWSRTLRSLPPFTGRFRAVEIPISIGASVDAAVHPAVAPFLVGRRAFSDPGELDNTERAFLGNLEFDRGERYGDVVLAAVRHLGRGKVVLFGDTSPFQNSALGQSHEFTAAVVLWLTNKTGSWRMPCVGLLALLLVLAAALVLRRSTILFAGAVAVAVAVGILCGDAILAPLDRTGKAEGPTALIDAAHGNLIRWEPLHDSGVEGLGINLARAGFLPFIYHEGLLSPPPSPHSVIVSVSPTRGFSPREAQDLLEWLAGGGGLIITTGWPQATVLRPFLAPLGMSIAPIPLGAVRPDIVSLDVQPELPSAWPLETTSEWRTLGSIEWDGVQYTVVAERAIGSGWIVVIGDHGVLLNENLEGKSFAFVENIALLSHLLSRPRGGEDPS
ncbi:DUF4350 domain-containing protein [Candidatus Bipolaricaulota bacterium]